VKEEDNLVTPLLSVCLITYNHAKYIEQAIEGVLNQNVNFPWELIIADDYSTDGTRDILIAYQKKYPEFIKLILQEKNVGAAENFIDLIAYSCSKYIAYFEGDDYWTDPAKLQKQVDFLEANQNYSICFHEVMILYDDRREILYNNIGENRTFDFLDLTHNNFIATVSCVFRAFEHHKHLPAWFKGYAGNDYGLKLLNATKGKIYYIKDCMAVYRVHNQGIWSSQSHPEMYENGIKVIDSLNAAFNFEYNEDFETAKKLRYAKFYPQNNVVIKESRYSKYKSKIKYYLSKVF
jgi:glycosyltransferase involved in cell wall biosynthesis